MDAPNVLVIVGVELERKKAETRRMTRRLRAKKLAVKGKKKEMRRIKRVTKVISAMNRHLGKMVDDFLVAADAENGDPETAKKWIEKALKEVIEGMNDLINLEGNIIL